MIIFEDLMSRVSFHTDRLMRSSKIIMSVFLTRYQDSARTTRRTLPGTPTTLDLPLGTATTGIRMYHFFPALAPPRSEAASVPANRPLLVNTVLVACVFTRSRGRPLASSDGAAFAGRCFLGGGASSRVFSTGLPLASSVHSTGCAALALPFFLCDREVPKSTCSSHRASNPAMNASSASGKYALG